MILHCISWKHSSCSNPRQGGFSPSQPLSTRWLQKHLILNNYISYEAQNHTSLVSTRAEINKFSCDIIVDTTGIQCVPHLLSNKKGNNQAPPRFFTPYLAKSLVKLHWQFPAVHPWSGAREVMKTFCLWHIPRGKSRKQLGLVILGAICKTKWESRHLG